MTIYEGQGQAMMRFKEHLNAYLRLAGISQKELAKSADLPEMMIGLESWILLYMCIRDIHPRDSQEEPGLQFIDNICSVLRLHRTRKDNENFYSLIEKMVREV